MCIHIYLYLNIYTLITNLQVKVYVDMSTWLTLVNTEISYNLTKFKLSKKNSFEKFMTKRSSWIIILYAMRTSCNTLYNFTPSAFDFYYSLKKYFLFCPLFIFFYLFILTENSNFLSTNWFQKGPVTEIWIFKENKFFSCFLCPIFHLFFCYLFSFFSCCQNYTVLKKKSF